MVCDLLTNIGNYKDTNRNLDKTIDYLVASDINTLLLGKTAVDGDRVFLQVMEAKTRQLTDESYEMHRDYMGTQVDIEGYEVVETVLGGMILTREYQPDFQEAVTRGGAGGHCAVGPGRFILYVTGEAYGPGGCL